jgi:hypothetical protein
VTDTITTPYEYYSNLVGSAILTRAAWWVEHRDPRAATLLLDLSRHCGTYSFLENPAHWIQESRDSSGCQLTGASSRVPVSGEVSQ